MAESLNIVMVHGAWADGSCWSYQIERLQADGYTVTAPQLPENSLADDVARVRLVLSRQSGPTLLVAHSYGGQVITALGTDAPNVVGLVYIAGFGLDEGESIGALLKEGGPEASPATANIEVDSEGRAWLPEDDFLRLFAAGIDPVKAKVMWAVQQPLTLSAFDDVMGTPAWKSQPTWFMVAEKDEVIPPDGERQFAQRMGADTIELDTGHVAMVSHPEETYELIVKAAKAVS
jgi:pimeloyl-ACP methyl ester carboxylesterase